MCLLQLLWRRRVYAIFAEYIPRQTYRSCMICSASGATGKKPKKQKPTLGHSGLIILVLNLNTSPHLAVGGFEFPPLNVHLSPDPWVWGMSASLVLRSWQRQWYWTSIVWGQVGATLVNVAKPTELWNHCVVLWN